VAHRYRALHRRWHNAFATHIKVHADSPVTKVCTGVAGLRVSTREATLLDLIRPYGGARLPAQPMRGRHI